MAVKRSLSGAGLVLAVAAIAAIYVWIGHAYARPQELPEETRAERLAGVERLLAFGQTSLKPGYRVSLQWSGSLRADEAAFFTSELLSVYGAVLPEAAAGDWSSCDFGGGASKEWLGSVSLLYPAEADGLVQAVVMLDGDDTSADALAQAMQGLDGWLRQAAGGWSVKLAGSWSGAAAAGEAPEGSLELMAGKLLAAEPDGLYREAGISNATYRSALLPFKAEGSGATSLQTALHRDTETGEWRLAIGSPVLTGEF